LRVAVALNSTRSAFERDHRPLPYVALSLFLMRFQLPGGGSFRLRSAPMRPGPGPRTVKISFIFALVPTVLLHAVPVPGSSSPYAVAC
jgi:hypothetical protein